MCKHTKLNRVFVYLLTILLSIGFVVFPFLSIEAKRILPKENLLTVFPSQIEGKGWNMVEKVGELDLSENSLLQDFSSSNSATLKFVEVKNNTTTNSVNSAEASPSASETNDNLETENVTTSETVIKDGGYEKQEGFATTSLNNIQVDQAVSAVQLDSEDSPEEFLDNENANQAEEGESAVTEEVDSGENSLNENSKIEKGQSGNLNEEAVSEPKEDKNNNVAEPVNEESGDVSLFKIFKKSVGEFLLTQSVTSQSTTSEIDTTQEENHEEVLNNDIVDGNDTSDVEVVEILEETIDDSFGSTSVNNMENSPDSAEFTESNEDILLPPNELNTDNLADEKITEEEEVESENNNSVKENNITLSGFGIAELNSGEVIDAVQLRMSLAGDLKSLVRDDSKSPILSVKYSFGSFAGESGSVIFDDEASNAVNGGYYLFSLPSITNEKLLNDLSVTISYVGDYGMVNNVYIDALWVEVVTKSYDKSEIETRKNKAEFEQLKAPSISELVSSQQNFDRFDEIKFNLRYSSQRNFFVRTARELFGKELASVNSVDFLHNETSVTDVSPSVFITKEGLITIEIPEEEKLKLKPGKYTLNMEIEEGGKTFNETFDFQWGMLSINPNQTTYVPGEEVKISLGSLSPNGNTVCDADLDLFIIAPDDSVHKIEVTKTGLCEGNNVVDGPDYTAEFITTIPGEYEMYLERLDENEEIIAYTSDTFLVDEKQTIFIERIAPTRINPLAPYKAQIIVHTTESDFDGSLMEMVPSSFLVSNTDGAVNLIDNKQNITWDFSMSSNSSKVFEYEFDAPNLSPYLFSLGPAKLKSDTYKNINNFDVTDTDPEVSTTTNNLGENLENQNLDDGLNNDDSVSSSSSPSEVDDFSDSVSPSSTQNISDEIISLNLISKEYPLLSASDASTIVFEEHRQWQIASDAVGNMILFWDDGASIPSGWTCLSCGSGTFYNKFAVGSSTYNTTGGATTHTHTATGTVAASTAASAQNSAGSALAGTDHSHTYSPTIGTANNLPEYRTLRVIQYTGGAGEPGTLPAGAIAVFDDTVPTGWTRYSAQDGKYIYGGDTPGSTGGSNTHTHTITGSVAGSGGSTINTQGGPPASRINAANAGHTHTVSSNTGSSNNEPPYINVILGKLNSATSSPEGMISMWTEDVPAGWIDVSSSPSDPFRNRFIKASTTYGVTGGSETSSHSNVTGIVSSGPNSTSQTQSGSFGSSQSHTHSVDVIDFSTVNHLPPYLTVIFGKRIGLDPTLTQSNYRWYTNLNDQTPTDPWSSGVAIDLLENTPISTTSTPVNNGDVVRLRVNAKVGNATSTTGTQVKLQYAAASVCASAVGWADVGSSASSTIWRGYNNSSVSDGSTLTTSVLASTTVNFTYEEEGVSAPTPNQVPVDGYGEWDFVIENNGANAGTEYCFRLVYNDGSTFFTYNEYPKLITNSAPTNYQLVGPFDNKNTASTTPNFDFYAVDNEGDDIDYQIQIATDYGFSSVVIDKNTVSNSSQFENQVLTSEKNPFTSGQLIRFTDVTSLSNGETYWWRIRGKDPDGSNEWGEWSDSNSFTITTSLTATGWTQLEDEQFEKGVLSGTEIYGSNQVRLITGSTTGTIISPEIDFNDADSGTAWDQLTFTDNTTNGSVLYQIQYKNESGDWNLIPNTDLSGNATGFSSSPVSLLSLDTDTYRYIRVLATLTNSGGTPYLENWSIDWGYRVETPYIDSPFSNEKIGTTTPSFIFTTTDPQSDYLTYQIEWSTDNTFSTGVTTRTSDTDAGFSNLEDGGDTDPFNSGEDILFSIQSGDALTNGETYWWRVRAKDTTGDNEYSFWTQPQSITIDTSVTASTWFQTTSEQFDGNVLSGTVSISDSIAVATTAREAMIVYGEGTETKPRYRLWNGSAWSSEGQALDIGSTLRKVITRAGVSREEYIVGTIGANGYLTTQVYAAGEWGNSQTMTTSIGSTATKGFDIAYESSSGDALVVYCDNDANPSYRIWNGSSWSSETSITSSLTSDCRWIEMASDPTSDEIILLLYGVNSSPYQVLVWNGSGWGNSSTFGTARVSTYPGMSVMYEEGGGQAIAVAPSPGGGPNRMVYNAWNGSAWTGETTQTIGGRLYWAELAQNTGNDELVLCYVNDNSEVRSIRWTGSAWAGDTQFTASVNSSADPALGCVFENSTGRNNYILGTYGDTSQSNYRVWNTSSWSGATQINSLANSATIQTVRTGDDLILGTFFDHLNTSLRFSSWNGSSWSTTETLEDNVSVSTSPYGYPYWVAPRNPGVSGSVIVSPAIVFSDGQGPYFDEFSWNDTTPGTSQILYQLQYFNGTSWQLIPDIDLPGNSSGTTTGPIDLSGLDTSTYGTIRPYASLTCDGSNNCPLLNDWTVTWAEGITVSGTIKEFNQTTDVTSGTVAVAVNGNLQIGKTGSINSGIWSINNVTTFAGDIVTVFVSGANNANEAVSTAIYSGTGDLTGMELYERHISIGSDNATTTPVTNNNLDLYTNTNTEDIFFEVSTSTLTACVESGCSEASLFIKNGSYYEPQGSFQVHDFDNEGIFTAGTYTHTVSGSWYDIGTSTLTNSTIVMNATSSTEIINNASSSDSSFYNLTFGTSTTNGVWQLQDTLVVNNDLIVSGGTLNRSGEEIIIYGSLTNGANGVWSGLGTTTFSGSGNDYWQDSNPLLQNVGRVVVDGSPKTIILNGNVAADNIFIGTDDNLDASTNNYSISIYGSWYNQNNFISRQGTVNFIGTTTNHVISSGGDNFYNLTFNGVGGSWSFLENNVSVSNNFTVSTGTVTLPTATTSVGGSWNSTGGVFAHNNGEVRFTANSSKNITVNGDAFNNNFYDLKFTGSGTWVMTDSVTTTNDFIITGGSVTLPTDTLAIGNNFSNSTGLFNSNSGTIEFYGSGTSTIEVNTSDFNSLRFTGSGNWSFVNSSVDLLSDLSILSGTVTLPATSLNIAGSYQNSSVVNPGTGTVVFDSSDTGEVIDFGNSDLYNVTFDNTSGGWTIAGNATATNNLHINNANNWTLQSGSILSVGNEFNNHVGGASTTWTGTTLSLESGSYVLNNKTDQGDLYNVLQIGSSANVKMWNSSASTYSVDSLGYLYSMDHNSVDGDLYIYGSYLRTGGTEYWSYATDFDGTDLATSSNERPVQVKLADATSVEIQNSTIEIIGEPSATTTITNQGSGTYVVDVVSGTTTANYYNFSNLGLTGLSLLSSTTVTTLDDGVFIPQVDGGTSITLSSTTINANPGKQIFRTNFATTTAITANNVTQTDGAPASFWWFRNGSGNLYGENFDNDTGDPGSVRFDDSSLIITVSGTVYGDDGQTPLIGGSCDGVSTPVKVMVNGNTSYTGSCSAVNGTYSIGGVVVIGDPVLTVYLDNASGGEKATVVTKTPTSDLTNIDLYANRVILRHEDVSPLNISDMAGYDFDNDADIKFIASTSTENNLLTLPGTELYIWASSTFSPLGTVTLQANAEANSYDGSLVLATSSTFNAYGTSTYTIGGRFVQGAGATFSPASSTVLMNATTTGKSITASEPVNFYELAFDGVGGGWNISADLVVDQSINIDNGTVTGTGDVVVTNGSMSGDGTLSLGGGTTTISKTNNLGGNTAWTFNNLILGSGLDTGTTTLASNATTTILGLLTIANGHILDAQNSVFDLAGTGNVMVETGTFAEGNSLIRYSGAGANVLNTDYYDLLVDAGVGPQTYVGQGSGILVRNDLMIGNSQSSTFDINTNDPVLEVRGDVLIGGNGTLSASNNSTLTAKGNWVNNGTFTNNNGIVSFTSSSTSNINAGNSNFYTVNINGTGDFTISNNATATNAWNLTNHNNFTVNSGQTLAVGGQFSNTLDGANTTWTGSTLHLFGNGTYSINSSTTADTYATISIAPNTQIRMWNSEASTYSVDSLGSLYSQDHGNVDGDLYIWGSLSRTSGSDYWSYATDFDGTNLSGGNERLVDVYFASGASALWSAGALNVIGTSSASTTLQNQGSGTYSLTIGGTASTNWRNVVIRDVNETGINFIGIPTVTNFSNTDHLVEIDNATAVTVNGTVIDQNPAKNFTGNIFTASGGVVNPVNVTATGTSVSSWRFTNHLGALSGEANDADPAGDPGYVVWDDSAALITISGNVYSDEGSTVSSVCDGSTTNIRLVVAGLTTYDASCNATTGAYSIPNVAFSGLDTLTLYINGESEKATNVTVSPISSISNMHLYENRVIVRHENTDPITISNMTVWDSSDDTDVLYTAIDSAPDTLTLPSNAKLLVWTGKTFAPNGNVTISGGGAGADYDGTFEVMANANFVANGTETHTIGGSMIFNNDSILTSASSTFIMTTTGSARTLDVNNANFHNLSFTGSGSWIVTDSNLNIANDYVQSAGSIVFPTATSTIGGSFNVTAGSFDINGSPLLFTATDAGNILRFNNSSVYDVVINGTGGSFSMNDTNATSTGDFVIKAGNLTLPSGNLAVAGDFLNDTGVITHNTVQLILTSTTTASLQAGSSDLHTVNFSGSGTFSILDEDISFLNDFVVSGGGAVNIASGTTAVGGSFNISSGSFYHSTGTVLLNASTLGHTINPDSSEFYNLQIGAPGGGYIMESATTTGNFIISNVTDFTAQSASVISVDGVFTNSVGGSATDWSNSTLILNSTSPYSINSKSNNGDVYNIMTLVDNVKIEMWSSSATTTNLEQTSSLYSQDHAGVDGNLYIYGHLNISTTTEYWSYATDFDGTNLSGGNERQVNVYFAPNATTTIDNGTLYVIGGTGNETTVQNQGTGTFTFEVLGGTLNLNRYSFTNIDVNGLQLSGSPTISELSNGHFELSVDTGSLITVSSTTVNSNPSLTFDNVGFNATSTLSGNNIVLNGATSNAWYFTNSYGSIAGESYDVDGIDDCGSIRFDDSSCLITKQSHYRWRNDDGGEGGSSSEWYSDSSFDLRKRVRVVNNENQTYSSTTVKLNINYESGMKSDFTDLRFTSGDGITEVPFWVEDYTASTEAQVWVLVPTLPASSQAILQMYYGSSTASSLSSGPSVFVAFDDFEDNNITEYSGDTSLFNTSASLVYGGSYALKPTDVNGKTTDGIFRFDDTVSQGEIIRYMQYVNTSAGSGDEACTLFAVQSPGTTNQNYAVCLEQFGTDRISISKNVSNSDTSGTVLASTTVSYSTGWYEVEIDWQTDDTIDVSLYNSSGTLVASTTASDSSYSSGGYGYSFWFQNGAWDGFVSWARTNTKPSVYMGVEQNSGGASWLSSLDTSATVGLNEAFRLRVGIENSGLPITNQEYRLEYSAKGAAPSCGSISFASYAPVPNQSSCSGSPICMATSTYLTNGESTSDHLFGALGEYVSGEVIESPSNQTNSINLNQDYYTELEYVLTTTENTNDDYCFKVSNAGTELDFYSKVAELQIEFTPSFSSVALNSGFDISLTPGTTTQIYATGTVTDLNGYADLAHATATIYRSGAGAACTPDNNNCYVVSTSDNNCSFINCAGNSCTLSCLADVQFHADPTDADVYEGQEWLAYMEVEDQTAGYDFSSAPGVELLTMRALDVDSLIDYGSLVADSDTGSYNPTTTVTNIGNTPIDIDVEATDLSDGSSSNIGAEKQKMATSTFTYSACASCYQLSSSTPVSLDLNLSKPNDIVPPTASDVYWGISIPFTATNAPHTGLNTFTAISI